MPIACRFTSYLGSMYDYFLTGIAKSRNINKDSLFNYANSGRIQQPEDALKYKLVDGLKYKDEILAELKQRTGKDEKSKIASVDLDEYSKSSSKATEPKEGEFS